MARGDETRAESIERLRKQAIRKIRTGLKERNINVPDIEGASEDDKDLRDLQEWQAIAKAFEDADTAPENSAQAGNRAVSATSGISSESIPAITTALSKGAK